MSQHYINDSASQQRETIHRLQAINADLLEALTEARERMMGSSPAIKLLIAKTDAAIAKAKQS